MAQPVSSLGAHVEIDPSALNAADEIKSFAIRLNECHSRLQSLKVSAIDPQGDPPMPKVVWKLLSTRQAIIYRAVELQNGISTLLNADNLLGAIILARTLVELMVFVGYLSEELSIATKNENLGAIDKAIQSSNFSTRWEDMPAEAKAKNILTLLEKFDRKIMKEEKELPVTDMHAILSEFTHPNWVGTAGFFGFIDKQTAVQHFSVVHRDRAGILGNICGGCMCLLFIERLVRELEDLAPRIESISEAAAKRQ